MAIGNDRSLWDYGEFCSILRSGRGTRHYSSAAIPLVSGGQTTEGRERIQLRCALLHELD